MDHEPSIYGDVPICGNSPQCHPFPLSVEQPLPLTIHPSVCSLFKQLADNDNTLRGELEGRSSSKNAYMLVDMSSQVPSFSDFDRKETDDQSGYQTTTSSPKL